MSEPATPPPAPNEDGGAPAADAPTPEPAAPTPTPDEQAEAAEDAEWDAASKEVFNNKEGDDEPAKPKEDGEKTSEGEENPADKKPNEEQGNGDDASQKTPDGAAKDSATIEREARATARVAAQQVEAIKTDVREKMFAGVPRTLQDADGDPINSIDDVMKLIDPRTGETFTDEAAGMWLLSAQQQFNQKTAEMDRTIDTISELNLDIKDQADSVIAKYGNWLKANPEKRDEIWANFEKTLIKHQESGLVLHSPIGLEWFYDQAVGPVANASTPSSTAPAIAPPPPPVASSDESAVSPQVDPAQAAVDKEAADKKAAKDAEEAKKKKRADRSDIYGGSNMDTRDDDDKEWDEATEAVFPGYKK
ncbi:MAG: hypothetical protein ACR2FM_04945 [Candidatus Saccharimonadales bacterium]